MTLPVTIACEGQIDFDAISHVCSHHGVAVGNPYITGGKDKLNAKLPGYAAAARYSPWIVQRDLDNDADCAPTLADLMLPERLPWLNFLITVRQTEAWFLADKEGLSAFLRVSYARLPSDPESIPDPKMTVVALARKSTRRMMRAGIVPHPDSGRKTGNRYGEHMAEFIRDHWSIDRAIAGGAHSLDKLVERINRFKLTGTWS